MSLPQPDLAVLRKAQRGDERAFAIIVRPYETPVYNYVLRLTNGDRALAEDLTQEVFLRVYQGLPRFSLRCKFTTWLFQVTKNRVLDELRAKERRPLNPINLDDAPQLEVLDQPVERAEAIDALWHAIDGLPVALKLALLPRGVVGLSSHETAPPLAAPPAHPTGPLPSRFSRRTKKGRFVTVWYFPISPLRKSSRPPGKCRTSSVGVALSGLTSDGSQRQRISTPRKR